MENKDLKEYGSYSLNNKKFQIMLSVCFLIIAAIGVGAIFLFELYKNSTVPAFIIVLSCVAFIVLHELMHIAAIKLFASNKITLQIKFPTIAVGTKSHFSKAQFIIIALAPVVMLGFPIILSTLFLGSQYYLLIAVLLTLNYASASGDYIQAVMALKQPKDTYFQDDANATKLFK